MAKLSDAMIEGLRKIAENRPLAVHSRTLDALEARFMIVKAYMSGEIQHYAITPTGAYALEQAKNAEAEAARQAERASRPVPATAFVEPSASTPLVWGGEYDEDEDGPETELPGMWEHADYAGGVDVVRGPDGTEEVTPAATSVQSVRLTPAQGNAEREATDAEVLQLLAVLDAGADVHRALYQDWGILDAGPFHLKLEAVGRAARDALRFGLARQAFRDREYRLSAEPVHLDAGNGMTACSRDLLPGAFRLRVTTDPAKVTHDRCK